MANDISIFHCHTFKIVCKLILFSYSPNKWVVILNILLYSLDIGFCFLWNNYNILYGIYCWITVIYLMRKNCLLNIIIFIISYIITIYPALVYNPYHFGQYFTFHQKLYKYVTNYVSEEYDHYLNTQSIDVELSWKNPIWTRLRWKIYILKQLMHGII